MKSNEEMLNSALKKLDQLHYIKTERIPDVELYMDQVTSFMEEHLKKTKRYPEDKVLTRTMINNYAKNNLLPAPVKKRYSREHILLLLFIYYFKSLLSFRDIQELFSVMTERHFHTDNPVQLHNIYEEVFSLADEQTRRLAANIQEQFRIAQNTFADVTDPDDKSRLQLFSFISELSFDVYMKTKLIEDLIDQMREEP